MPTNYYDNIESAVDDFRQDLAMPKNGRTTVYRTRIKPFIKVIEGYNMFFSNNFYTVVNEYPLTMTDIKIFAYLNKNVEFGNKIIVKQKEIVKNFNMDRSNVSKSIRRLEDAKIILKIGSDMYINPHISLKANPHEQDKNLEMLINIASEMIKGTNIKPSVKYKDITEDYDEYIATGR